jgi:L-threonylcarbamoyladenylate synthase
MEIIRLSDELMREALERARDVLARGGIVLYPTDTLYGLAVDAHNPAALSRLRLLKGRETKKPISIVAHSVEALDEYVAWNAVAKELAERHLPGALTLVLPARPGVPEGVQLIGHVGVRVPNDTFSQRLAHLFGGMFTATSANRSGEQTLASIDQILRQFGPRISEIDLVIDAGERAGGIGSTVVTFRDGKPYILREGIIPREELGF